MRINYFDFGLHYGDEIDMFLSAVRPLAAMVTVYGFEAHPDLSQRVAQKYKDYPDISIINKAIAPKGSKPIPLYIAEGNKMEGNSIFSTKYNVDKQNFVYVEGIVFSEWLLENVPDYKESINVVRFNIEGAEIYLLKDIISNNIHRSIKLFLGASGGVDILKCEEIAHLHKEYERRLIENDIFVHQFCAASHNNIPNDRICQILTNKK